MPGIVKYAIAMPDIHSGYGPPIGGVGAIKLPDGVISPGFVGYDENCGCRLLLSNYQEKDIKPHLESLASEIQKEVEQILKLCTAQWSLISHNELCDSFLISKIEVVFLSNYFLERYKKISTNYTIEYSIMHLIKQTKLPQV